MAKPSLSVIKKSVKGGLGTSSNLRQNVVISLKFEPSIGIAAGRIEKLGVDIRSYRVPLHAAVRDVMTKSITRNFDMGGRPKWTRLAKGTIDNRVRLGYGAGPILVRSGHLKRVAGQINIWDISRTSAVIRDMPDDTWGKLHQQGYEGSGGSPMDIGAALTDKKAMKALQAQLSGGTRSAPTIPARPFLVIHPKDEKDIELIFRAWLGARVQAAWKAGRF